MKNTPDWLEESCGNCRFYGGGSLTCKRHAPIVVQHKEHSITKYPTTFWSSWCGDWEFQEDVKIRTENQNHA